MKSSWKNKTLLAFLAVIFVLGLSAQDIPKPMHPPRLVNDFANIFSSTELQALEHKLLAYNDSTSTQIYVVTVKDLKGYDISDFAFRLGEAWGIGQKNKDNGALILIKPRIGNSRGNVFIATGYGLEEKITDAFTGQVIRQVMTPHFRDNDYFSGVNEAVDAIIARLSGSFTPDQEDDSGISFLTILFIVIFILIILSMFSGGGDQHIDSDGHRNSSGDFFFPPFSGGRGGFGSGGSFGGGGLGGFGGGGGGSFGGGGAGGSW